MIDNENKCRRKLCAICFVLSRFRIGGNIDNLMRMTDDEDDKDEDDDDYDEYDDDDDEKKRKRKIHIGYLMILDTL